MELRLSAIVIGKRETGETDRLYSLYTRELGKVRAKAIGVRKPAAKLASALETLTLSDVTVVRGKGAGRIAGSIAEETFPNIRADFAALSLALSTVAEFDAVVGLEQPDEELFSLLLEYLSLLDEVVGNGSDTSVTTLLTEAFFVKFLDILGYRIEAEACAVSGDRVRSGERCFFSPSAGGIVTEAHAGRDAVRIGENAVKLIRLFLGHRLRSLLKVRAGATDLAEVGRIRTGFLRYALGK
ncbi:MAG: DNA repair protein RecO [Candidatus Moranbacteria bacterium]|nr:DNA repair protein RecO [Candidatus Moranbacteria bacterium]NTW46467.1 DNA repair protein RecO [Candidatus Moranbacteria bacterium]